ncbi:GNAT family N-acetyltransferase [Flavobacterium sp. NG2]|uniref:GNAT family N-acetyltransferase n=1 Tax=Flavobacterium sp. NG2 TaxID=3097547 RepID=UPI002A80AC1A|nr:GNAT family N-acetyltransferase [Flavobacterium sp. NG2]WPR73062.1 GNAT family N-acetyltransferase [Flavobacterium sp. NG2]
MKIKQQIENANIDDLNTIYWLFEEAISYQKKKKYVGWNNYDKDFIVQDVKNKLQFKITQENNTLCIFSVCFRDPIIWRKREQGDAIYIHRIIVNPNFKGQSQFKKVLNWAIEIALKKKLKYIRMETWADNSNLIEYYKSFGFQFIEYYTAPNSNDLPYQQRNIKAALLEIKL